MADGFDGNGAYTLPIPQYPAVAGTVIYADDWNTVLESLAAALSLVLVRDGQAPMTGDLAMGAHKLTGVTGVTADTGGATMSGTFTFANGATFTLAVMCNAALTVNGALTANGAATFSGTTTAPTQAISDNSTKVATTEFVQSMAIQSVLPTIAGHTDEFITNDGVIGQWSPLPIHGLAPLYATSMQGGL